MRGVKLSFVIVSLLTAIVLCAGGCAHAPVAQDKPPDYDAVVVGAGMGGLSAGAHLANKGMKVLVLEQHHKVGGCTSSFSRGEFNFDAALHEMAGGGSTGPLAGMLKEVGVYNKVEFIRIPNLYRSIFPGVDFTYPGDYTAAVKAMQERWPKESSNIEAFHELMGKVYSEGQSMSGLYRKSAFGAGATMSLVPFRQPNIMRYYKATLKDALDKYFKDESLKAVMSQLWVYYGPPPSRIWSIIFMSANYSYLAEGAWQIKGSSQALANAYAQRIEELGGKVKTGTMVTQILVDGKRAHGVRTESGETYTAKYVVSNADPFQTFFKLVGEDKTPKSYVKKIKSMKPGVSIVGVYLGLDVPPSFWKTTDHEIFYNPSLDADENYKNMMEGNYANAACAMTFYTNLGDPFYSPPGKSVFVMHSYSEASKWPKDREAYQKRKAEVGDQLIAQAEKVFPHMRDHIVVKEVVTPLSLEAFTMQTGGIPYGWDFTVDQGLRLTNNTPIEGLYLAGSWTNPGHGVSTAQISGYQAARLIADREGVK